MVIRTYEHGYSVVSRPEYGDGWSIYLCRGIGDGREYSMLSRKNDADCAGIAEYLAGVIKSGTFTDLVEFLFRKTISAW
jgi:hypothetical protein